MPLRRTWAGILMPRRLPSAGGGATLAQPGPESVWKMVAEQSATGGADSLARGRGGRSPIENIGSLLAGRP